MIIRFVAGYGDDSESVPDQFAQAIRLIVGHWYENREAVQDTRRLEIMEIPMGATDLLKVDRNW